MEGGDFCMSSIDERVVAMKFNNQQFEKGVKESTTSLESFKKVLTFDKARQAISDLASAGKNFTLSGMANGIEAIANKFNSLSVMGVAAITNITNKAVNAGLEIGKSLTIDPIKAGFDEYELKMGSIQTILSNTARYGTQLPTVTAELDKLNAYADQTIYNFGDMTKNIGLFTNAGIRIEDATSMIKGFSNAAAASGTSAEGASHAAQQLSQAINAGTIRAGDWQSLTTVGMGNKNMQDGLYKIGVAMGKVTEGTEEATSIQSNFRGSLESGWLEADIMSSYLKILSSDTKEQAVQQALALGLTQEQADAFGDEAMRSKDAATKVRTFSQLMGTMKEAVGSGWSETFGIIIGDFNQATDLWTGVNNVFGEIIGKQSEARNAIVTEWAKFGGRDIAIDAISTAFQALLDILKPIKDAFGEIFPPVTGKTLVTITDAVRDFAHTLTPSAETIDRVKRIAKGLFAVLDIGWMVVKQVAGVFADLFKKVGKGSGGFLEVAANLGDFLVKVRDAIKKGEGLGKVFEWIGNVLEKPIEFLGKLGEKLADFTNVEKGETFWSKVGDVFQRVGEVIKKAWEALQPFFDWVGEAFGTVKDKLVEFFKSMDFNTLLGLLNIGAVAGVGGIIGGLLKKIFGLLEQKKKGPGLMDKIKEMFGGLTDTFKQMQQTLKAAILMEIAIAIGIITLSIIALSFIDPVKLAASLAAITIMIGDLVGAMILLDKFSGKMKTGKLLLIGGAMIAVAVALLIMAAAAKVFSTMSWEELGKGMAAMATGLGLLIGFVYALPKDAPKKLAKVGLSLIFISAGMLIFAVALKSFAEMSWEDLGKGVAAVSALLTIIAIFNRAVKKPKKLFIAALSVVMIATAMVLLGNAVEKFGKMDMEVIGKGMVAMAGALLLIVIASKMIPKSAIVSAAVLVILAFALANISDVLQDMGSMSWEEIAKSMVVLAGSLAILAGAMALMGIPEVLIGAVGIVAAALALMMMAPALKMMGSMSWEAIGKSLALLASALGILAVMGVLLIPASVGFLLLGVAMLLIGAGAMMAGTGMLMFSAGIVALAAAGVVGALALRGAILIIIGLIPAVMIAIAKGIIEFAKVIATGGEAFMSAFVTLFMSLIEAVNTVAPALIECVVGLIHLLVDAIVEMVPYLVESGMTLLTGLIQGLADGLPDLMTAAGDLIANFITGLGEQAEKIATAGGEAVIKFIDGMADWIDANAWKFQAAGTKLFKAIVEGVSDAIENGGYLLSWAGEKIGTAILEGAKNALGINSPSKKFRDDVMPSVFEGIEDGNDKNLSRAGVAGAEIGDVMIDSMKKSISSIANAVATDIDATPTIRPVLDLSAIKKDVGLIGGMFTDPSLNVASNYSTAAGIATTQKASDESTYSGPATVSRSAVTFIQNNNSPKALSNAEIYRQTSNQLSIAKRGLTTPNV